MSVAAVIESIDGNAERSMSDAVAGAVTADPSEGEAFTESGTDLVEPVPMPEPIRVMVDAFIAEHHVEQAFYKRKQKRVDPEALARGRPVAKDDDA